MKRGETMYYVMIFKILSEIKVGKMKFQEIDKRHVKTFDKSCQAKEYLSGIRNKNLMYNFSFAVIGEFDKKSNIIVKQQHLYIYDRNCNAYVPLDNKNKIADTTLSILHPFKDNVVIEGREQELSEDEDLFLSMISA